VAASCVGKLRLNFRMQLEQSYPGVVSAVRTDLGVVGCGTGEQQLRLGDLFLGGAEGSRDDRQIANGLDLGDAVSNGTLICRGLARIF